MKNNAKLTNKEEAFVKHLVENPKQSATKAVLATYNTTDPNTAGVIAYENLRKPKIISELSKYNNLVENTLINTVNEYQDSDDIKQRTLAVDTSKYIHDKIHGKATNRTENININIEQYIDELV